jgi:DNA-binding IclR family transcriptional regulator
MTTEEEEARGEEPIPHEEAVQVERLLAVIQRHPEGVSIVDIGNELGVDWRSLIATLQPLEEERKIERINTMYYPGEKAGEGEL